MKTAVKYCIEHGVLGRFFEINSSEVFNMLLTEWDTEEAKEVWFEEGMEAGIEKSREEIAGNALAEGASVQFVHKITGLDNEAIKAIQAGM